MIPPPGNASFDIGDYVHSALNLANDSLDIRTKGENPFNRAIEFPHLYLSASSTAQHQRQPTTKEIRGFIKIKNEIHTFF